MKRIVGAEQSQISVHVERVRGAQDRAESVRNFLHLENMWSAIPTLENFNKAVRKLHPGDRGKIRPVPRVEQGNMIGKGVGYLVVGDVVGHTMLEAGPWLGP